MREILLALQLAALVVSGVEPATTAPTSPPRGEAAPVAAVPVGPHCSAGLGARLELQLRLSALATAP
jgi:hypothetical protein